MKKSITPTSLAGSLLCVAVLMAIGAASAIPLEAADKATMKKSVGKSVSYYKDIRPVF